MSDTSPDFTRRFFYDRYVFTESTQYRAVEYHAEGDASDHVCYVHLGDTVEDILGKIERYEWNRRNE